MRRRKNNGKSAAALEASNRIRDGQTIGVGSGVTAALFLQVAAEKIKNADLNIYFVPSSSQIAFVAKNLNLLLRSLDHIDHVDLTVDGADEVDTRLRLVKGGGGALVKERILAHLSDYYLIIADESKLSSSIGHRSSIPIEITASALTLSCRNLEKRNISYQIRLDKRGYPIITENGNFLLDANFPVEYEPETFFHELKILPGVLDVGIFLHEADEVIIGLENGTTKLIKRVSKH